MVPDHKLRQLHHTVQETGRLSAAHCSGIRKTVGENTRLVEQSIELLLRSKEVLRHVDELLSGTPRQPSMRRRNGTR